MQDGELIPKKSASLTLMNEINLDIPKKLGSWNGDMLTVTNSRGLPL